MIKTDDLAQRDGRHFTRASYQALDSLPRLRPRLAAAAGTVGDERIVTVSLENTGKAAVLGAKLTLVDHMGARILPARYSDNYLTLLPGEPRRVTIAYPAKFGTRASVNLRGWNVRATSVKVREGGVAGYAPLYQQAPVYAPAPKVNAVEVKLPRR